MSSDNFQAYSFGSNNLNCIFAHNLHMQKASELNKGMDLVVEKGLPYPALLHEVLFICSTASKKIRFPYLH